MKHRKPLMIGEFEVLLSSGPYQLRRRRLRANSDGENHYFLELEHTTDHRGCALTMEPTGFHAMKAFRFLARYEADPFDVFQKLLPDWTHHLDQGMILQLTGEPA